jgi:type IV pilus assembly protein PilA
MFNKKGFTLVELMIVVAIIGILAAIAIPNFSAMQYLSKRSELQPNIKAIKTAQLSYDASFDEYVNVTSFHPDSSPSKGQREFTTGSAFDTIGWMPDGLVRGSYKVASTGSTDFLVTGISDVDGDLAKSSWTATKTLNVTMNTRNDVY